MEWKGKSFKMLVIYDQRFNFIFNVASTAVILSLSVLKFRYTIKEGNREMKRREKKKNILHYLILKQILKKFSPQFKKFVILENY